MPDLSVEDHVRGVLAGERPILARTITLIESNAPAHFERAQAVLTQLLPHTGKSIRVGITGIPGAGKSSLIERLGGQLVEQGHKVAVLAIDPSSHVTGGSILGDKTRMENLSQQPNAFIRPSPSGGVLGGVARKTRESILICEAAGFDVILIETVGTGQSEISVRAMVDCLLLLMIAGAGDELQGIKRGIVEIADIVAVNKADGDNLIRAQATRAELSRALHYLSPATEGWQTHTLTCSAMTGDGIAELWRAIQKFQAETTTNGGFAGRRQAQLRNWLHDLLQQQVMRDFYAQPQIQSQLPALEQATIKGEIPATTAVQRLLAAQDTSGPDDFAISP
jgi:LAO/AO transport system kinase